MRVFVTGASGYVGQAIWRPAHASFVESAATAYPEWRAGDA